MIVGWGVLAVGGVTGRGFLSGARQGLPPAN